MLFICWTSILFLYFWLWKKAQQVSFVVRVKFPVPYLVLSYICLLWTIILVFHLQEYFSLFLYTFLYTCSNSSACFIWDVSKETLCPTNNVLKTASCLYFLPTLGCLDSVKLCYLPLKHSIQIFVLCSALGWEGHFNLLLSENMVSPWFGSKLKTDSPLGKKQGH